jgi:hypothetical protein
VAEVLHVGLELSIVAKADDLACGQKRTAGTPRVHDLVLVSVLREAENCVTAV